MAWNIPQDNLDTIQEALDDFITNWGKSCTIYYPAIWESCANCGYDEVTGKSTNRWKHGGPIPFQAGNICPICSGSGGHRVNQPTGTFRALCEFTPSKFFYPIQNLDIRVPFSYCQTKGYLTDLPALQRADYILVETPIAGVTKLAYKMAGEGVDIHKIIQGRYCVVTWERVGR